MYVKDGLEETLSISFLGKRLNRVYPGRTTTYQGTLLYRHYTHAADWPVPHFTPFRRGSARVYPAASFFVHKLYPAAPDLYPDQTANRRK